MSQSIALNAQHRTVIGKQVAALRRAGITPIVVYGHATEPVALQVDSKELTHALGLAGKSRLITLKVADEQRPRMTLLRDVQRHVTRLSVLHADLLQVAMDETVRSEVQLEFVGEPLLAQRHEALVEHDLTRVTVEALPGDLPSSIVVDCSSLAHLGDTITVADLATSGKFQILHDPEVAVVRLQSVSRKVEVHEEGLPEEESTEPEVLTSRSRDRDEGED
jgi:large subunit ribosomal protein L25